MQDGGIYIRLAESDPDKNALIVGINDHELALVTPGYLSECLMQLNSAEGRE